MALPEAYLNTALSNIEVLKHLNHTMFEHRSWPVTITFYTAVQLVNSYIKQEFGKEFASHKDVMECLKKASTSKTIGLRAISDEAYNGYIYLRNKSRIARYLHQVAERGQVSHVDVPKSIKLDVFVRCIGHLDTVCQEYVRLYPDTAIPVTQLYLCGKDPQTELRYFEDIGQPY